MCVFSLCLSVCLSLSLCLCLSQPVFFVHRSPERRTIADKYAVTVEPPGAGWLPDIAGHRRPSDTPLTGPGRAVRPTPARQAAASHVLRQPVRPVREPVGVLVKAGSPMRDRPWATPQAAGATRVARFSDAPPTEVKPRYELVFLGDSIGWCCVCFRSVGM
jgi:hypothetical protein